MNHSAYIFFMVLSCLQACNSGPRTENTTTNARPVIYPDYTDIHIPVNIAPLNFRIEETGDKYQVDIFQGNGKSLSLTSRNGKIAIPQGKWNKLLRENSNGKLEFRVSIKRDGKWFGFEPFHQYISSFPIDQYLYYRLLYPGYESWSEISIVRRKLENFSEKKIINNQSAEQNCVNCHSFNPGDHGNMLFHIRGSLGGTYILSGGDLEKFNLKPDELKNGAVYPRWHPSGKFVAFSSNRVIQQFHSLNNKKIEVSDLESDLVLFDLEKNEIMKIFGNDNQPYLDTYPEWSPDGRQIYFCRADHYGGEFNYDKLRYNLYMAEFNPAERSFGPASLIYDASATGKSISFPRMSPEGNMLVFTTHDYGCFPIWHSEADLYALNPADGEVTEMPVNSNFTESYHSWASNGRWLIFSSKRDDGLTARPYITFIAENGKVHKPFILPQKDPDLYKRMLHTINIPEFAKTDVPLSPGKLKKATNKTATQVKWVNNQ
jgi:hypothetical protein